MTTQLPVTMETYGKVQSLDSSGRAWALYCFYARAAVKQDSSQPLCTDMFCKNGLKWNLKTVRKTRKILEQAEVIELERKFRYSYVKVNFLTVRLKNKRFELSEVEVECPRYGLELIQEHWPQWWERLTGSCFDEFMKRLKKHMQVNEMPDYDEAFHYLNVVGERMQDPYKGVWNLGPRCELAFWGYLIESVAKEFTTHMKANGMPPHSTQKMGRMTGPAMVKNG